jgi:kynurenine formamidase
MFARKLVWGWCGLLFLALAGGGIAWWAGHARSDDAEAALKGWQKGKGWGWIWGPEDEVGALNALTDPSRLAALSLVREGKVYDLGITYSAKSYKFPGHSPAAILSYRTPEGIKRQGDVEAVADPRNTSRLAWHSCAIFMNDNVATQIDGLGHITVGDDNHWYNGFKESDWGGNFGIRKCDAAGIPPIIARGVMLDIAILKEVPTLPGHYAISPADVDAALARQKTTLRPGDAVFFRTGTLRHWGADGADVATIGEHDSAGISLATAKYLVEEHGAILIGSDTSGLEVHPPHEGADSFIPVHKYLLVEQGVHIAEFHNLEALSRDKVYEFCYIATTNRIAGTTAGFAMRPLALR